MESGTPQKIEGNPPEAPFSGPGRLAPSPTGALHLGNARSFLIGWALARREGRGLLMRVEDLDGPRVKRGAERAALDTLAWLGLDWDGPLLRQSDDLAPYTDAMSSLAGAGLAYPCAMSRQEILEAASAPQQAKPGEGPGEVRFPPHLRPPGLGSSAFDEREISWRFAVPQGPVPFTDRVVGQVVVNPFETVGDFAVWTGRGQPSYQLACMVDDAGLGMHEPIGQVVRGDDLIDSAGRQLLLARSLGEWEHSGPEWVHLPLVVGEDGRRLAKRHGDTRVSVYREASVRPERVVGLLAWWSGVLTERGEMSAAEFRDAFSLDRMPRDPVVCTSEDDRWLRGG
ncbi:MAG: glutamate--tRNA ligase family protein [Planctomycetota bacterium]